MFWLRMVIINDLKTTTWDKLEWDSNFNNLITFKIKTISNYLTKTVAVALVLKGSEY